MILTIEKRPGRNNRGICEMGCRDASGTPRSAAHIAWILARKTLICRNCAKSMPELWARALAGFPDDEATS